jgi:hypothetical protein
MAWGRAAFEPKMMVSLLLYAYAVGERSSRGIERRCREDVAFRVLCANQVPDHATIARFRARHEQALADTFEHVLALCAKAGLVSVGLVALDGSLIAGDASQGATRSYPQIRAEVERMLEEAAITDEREHAPISPAISASISSRARTATASRRKSPCSPESTLATTSGMVMLWPSAIVVFLSSVDLQVNRRVWGPRWPDFSLAPTRASLHHFYRRDQRTEAGVARACLRSGHRF